MGVVGGSLAPAFPSALIIADLLVTCLLCFPLPSSCRSLMYILVFLPVHTADPAWLQIPISLL